MDYPVRNLTHTFKLLQSLALNTSPRVVKIGLVIKRIALYRDVYIVFFLSSGIAPQPAIFTR
jgi:hypothetical protein